jgi:hypothetical protein
VSPLFALVLAANPVGEGELKVALTARGEPEYSARVGGGLLLPTHHRLVLQLDSKALSGAVTLGGRLSMMTKAWALSVSFLTDGRGEIKPEAAARLTLPGTGLGKLELWAKYAPGDELPYLLGAALSPRNSLLVIRLESSISATSVSLSFRSQ